MYVSMYLRVFGSVHVSIIISLSLYMNKVAIFFFLPGCAKRFNNRRYDKNLLE